MAKKINEVFCKSGTPVKKRFVGKIEKDGVITLVPDGKDNLYLQIQADRDSCDINILIERFKAGDKTALEKARIFYGDVSNAPLAPHEMLNMVYGAQETFEQLPLEVRERFDFDFNKFFCSMDTKEWFDKMKIDSPTTELQVDQHTYEKVGDDKE